MNVSLTGHSESAVTEVVVLDNANISPSVCHNLTNQTEISKFFSSQSLEKTKKKKRQYLLMICLYSSDLMKSEERQRLAKERREEKAKYLGE